MSDEARDTITCYKLQRLVHAAFGTMGLCPPELTTTTTSLLLGKRLLLHMVVENLWFILSNYICLLALRETSSNHEHHRNRPGR